MSEIILYVVVDKGGDTIAFDEGTLNFDAAVSSARALRGRVIAREYEYSDSWPAADYTELAENA